MKGKKFPFHVVNKLNDHKECCLTGNFEMMGELVT